jgi:hypothetical protein
MFRGMMAAVRSIFPLNFSTQPSGAPMRFVVKMSDEDLFGLRGKCEKFANELLVPDDLTIDERADFALQEFKYELAKSADHLFVSVVHDSSTK